MNLHPLIYRIITRLPFEPKRRLYRLEVEAKDIELLTIKDFVQRICDSAGCTPKETSNIKLAIDEACSNIIRHAYKDKVGGKITLEMGIGFADLMIKIIDYGHPFDFRGIKDPDLNHYVDIGKKGGLGIWLIKKVMTDVRYKAFPDHNELTLYRHLSKAPPKELGLKKGSYSISTKFSLGSIVLIFFLIASAFLYLNKQQQAKVYQQQRDKVVALLQTMSAEAGALMSRKSDLELDRLIREVMASDKDKVLSYSFVTSAEGRYLAHSDLDQLFKTYVPPPGVHVTRNPGIQIFRIQTPTGSLTDYASAVYFHGDWIGEFHVGESDAAIQQI